MTESWYFDKLWSNYYGEQEDCKLVSFRLALTDELVCKGIKSIGYSEIGWVIIIDHKDANGSCSFYVPVFKEDLKETLSFIDVFLK